MARLLTNRLLVCLAQRSTWGGRGGGVGKCTKFRGKDIVKRYVKLSNHFFVLLRGHIAFKERTHQIF